MIRNANKPFIYVRNKISMWCNEANKDPGKVKMNEGKDPEKRRTREEFITTQSNDISSSWALYNNYNRDK